MKKRTKSYALLIAFGLLLTILQFIATMGAHDLALLNVQHHDAVNRVMLNLQTAHSEVIRGFESTQPAPTLANHVHDHIRAAEKDIHRLLEGDPDSEPEFVPLKNQEARVILERIAMRIDDLQSWLAKRTDATSGLPDTLKEDVKNAFTLANTDGDQLLSWLQHSIEASQDLHQRLEALMLVLITIVVLAGAFIIRRNDRVQQRLTKRIAADEKDLRTTINSITEGVIAIDQKRCVTRMNTVAQQLTGMTIETAKGLAIGDVFQLKDEVSQKQLSSDLETVLNIDVQAATSQRGELKSQDGRTYQIESRTSQIHGEHGQLLGAVIVFRHLDDELELRRRLKDQEARYKSIVESSPNGLYVYELMDDGRLIMRDVNPAASELVGADQSKNVGKTIEDAFPGLVETEIPDAYRRVAKTGETWFDDQVTYEDDLISGAFSVRAFQIAPNWMVAAFSNITKRKQAEHKLIQSEAKYRYLFETMEQGIVYQDTDERFIQANPAALRILGLIADDLYGKSFHSPEWQTVDEFGTPLTDDAHPASIAMHTRRPVTDFIMGVVNQSEATPRWLSVTSTPEFRSGEDTPYRVYTTFHDVTARKNALNELEKLRNLLASIINSMPSVLIGVDTDCKVTHWNNRAETVTGITQDDAVGHRPDELYPAYATYASKAERAIATQEIVEESHSYPEGYATYRYEDITIYPLVSSTVNGAVIRIDDVTEQRQLVEQLRQSQKMEAVGQLAGGIAHDFNNMLGGILGAAELLKDDVAGQQLDFVKIIMDSAERAADLTKKLLAFSRKGNVDSSPFDVHQAITSAIALLAHTLDKRISMGSDLQAENSTVRGDAAHLQNAFINMGINAGHAMPDGGTLTFSTRETSLNQRDCDASTFDVKPGDYLEISVEDTGCGIPPDVIDRIFEPFFTTRPVGAGTGLGLSAVYGTVQQHQGAIAVQSQTGVGTTFRILLPLSPDTEPEIEKKVGEIAGSGRVLLVDDESIIRDTAKALLEDAGFSVLLAEHGKAAVDLYQREMNTIDLILLDMLMPELDGKDTFSALKEINPDVKVIICSGYSPDANLNGMMEEGLVGFIHKPYRGAELAEVVAKAIAKR